MAKARKPANFEAYYIDDIRWAWTPRHKGMYATPSCQRKNPRPDFAVDGKLTEFVWLPDPKKCASAFQAKRKYWGPRQVGATMPTEDKAGFEAKCWTFVLCYRPTNHAPWIPYDWELWHPGATVAEWRRREIKQLAVDPVRSHWNRASLVPNFTLGHYAKSIKCRRELKNLVRFANEFRKLGLQGRIMGWRGKTPIREAPPILRKRLTEAEVVKLANSKIKIERKTEAFDPFSPGGRKRARKEGPKKAVKRLMKTTHFQLDKERREQLKLLGLDDDKWQLDKETPSRLVYKMPGVRHLEHADVMAASAEGAGAYHTDIYTQKGDTYLEVRLPPTKAAKAKAKVKVEPAPKAPKQIPSKRGTAASGNGCTRLTKREYDDGWRIYFHDLPVLGKKELEYRRECYRSKERVRYVVTGIMPGGFILRALKWFRTAKDADQYAGDARRYRDRYGEGYRVVQVRPVEQLPVGEQIAGLKATTQTKKPKAKPSRTSKQIGLFK
jgi:hypothetical protein